MKKKKEIGREETVYYEKGCDKLDEDGREIQCFDFHSKYVHPISRKVRMGNFLVKMEIKFYSTLLDKRSHLIGPFQKRTWRKKQINS
jgi:hypothetical protein